MPSIHRPLIRSAFDSHGTADERFFKSLDDFSNRLGEIYECFHNRLSAKRIIWREDYTENRFGIVVKFKRHAEADGKAWAVCLDAHASAVNHGSAILASRHKIAAELDDVGCRHDKPVFVDVVELVKGPDGPIPSLERLYYIEDKRIDIFEGLLY